MKDHEYTAYAVQTIRNRLGISQEKLARKLDVSLKTVYRYESGERAATGQTAVALARLSGELGCDEFEKFFNECAANRKLLLKQEAAEEMHVLLKQFVTRYESGSNAMLDIYIAAKLTLDKAEGK